MGTVTEKLQYTLNAVDDMQLAFTEIGVDCPDTDELATYGDKIRGLSKLKVYSKYVDITAGTWSGVALSDSAWKDLVTSSIEQSVWEYLFEKEIDPSKVKFIAASFIEKNYGIRISRGYASNSTTAQYQYIPALSMLGSTNVSNISAAYGGLDVKDSYAQGLWEINNNNYNNLENAATGSFVVRVEKDRIKFVFNRIDRGIGAIRSTKPYFSFAIGYED